VPIAVPESCSQKVSAKLKILCSITIVKVCNTRSVGKFGGRLFTWSVRNLWMEFIPTFVSMLVYIAVASAVNRRASLGRFKSFRSLMMVAESLIKDYHCQQKHLHCQR
jgi:hypothetical protein